MFYRKLLQILLAKKKEFKIVEHSFSTIKIYDIKSICLLILKILVYMTSP
jgi:hypothetical protein